MATADNAGTEIHYEVTGEGTPVLLLHGFPDSGRLWRHQVPALTGAGYRVIVPDMRGYGRSARPVEVGAYDILHLVSDVGVVLADVGVPRAHVVGHDWGAAAAWVLASVAPDTVDRLVALSIGYPATFRGRPGQLNLDQLEKAWFMLLFQSFVGPPTSLPAVQAPTLGVWSSGDFALTEAQMTRSAEHVAGSWRYARLEAPGHWMQLEAPDRVNTLLLDFLTPK